MITIKMSREDNEVRKDITINIEDFVKRTVVQIKDAIKDSTAIQYYEETDNVLHFLTIEGVISRKELSQLRDILDNAMDDRIIDPRF